MPHADTGMRARLPDQSGYALNRDGLRIYYEVFGSGDKTIVLMPAYPISHSRMWKGQLHYLSRHFRVVTYDGVGNGMSDHPDPKTLWSPMVYANDCLTVMDATDTKSAVLAGICHDGVWPSIVLAASEPERVQGIIAFAPGIRLGPVLAARAPAIAKFEDELDSYEGWFKLNRHYIQDKGKFPSKMLADLHVSLEALEVRKAGVLPYLTVLGGVLVVAVAWWYYWAS